MDNDHLVSEEDDEPDWDVVPIVSSVHTPRGLLTVGTLVIATKPTSLAVSHLNQTIGNPLMSGENEVLGYTFTRGDVEFVILEKDVRFDPRQVVDFRYLVLLHSQPGTHGVISSLSTKQSTSKGPAHPIHGMAADQFTRSVIRGTESCTVLVNEYSTLHVELEGLLQLWSVVSAEIGIEDPTAEESIKEAFRRQVPINKRVPMYT